MSKVNKIVFVGFLSGYGGAEKSMTMIANELAKLGHEVTVISFKNSKLVYEMEKRISYIFIPDKKRKKITNIPYRFWELRRKLGGIKPDIVISFWFQPSVFITILSKFIGFKTIYSERGDPTDSEYRGVIGVIRNLCFKYTDGFVFQSDGAKRCFSESIQKRSIVINNPVYLKFNDYPIPNTRSNVIVNVGRLHEQKNQQLLINSFAKISDEFPNYYLEIYGEGHLKNNLLNQISKLNLKDRISLKGTTQQLFDKIYDASLFVLSSDYEGLPNALIEAMALGIPCVSTDCRPGGARELINHNVSGLISKRGSEEDLANNIRYMLNNPLKAERMGTEAKNICYSHSPGKVISMWEKYLMGIIERNQTYE